jgi:predicted nucleic acid-binding protein
MTFIDTSAIYAWTDRGDPNHEEAKRRLSAALQARESLLTHNYVLVECGALLQKRLGLEVAISVLEDARLFELEWVERGTHEEAVRRLKARRRRQVSLVDQVSFLVMRTRGIDTAFAFDRHFEDEGFRIFVG